MTSLSAATPACQSNHSSLEMAEGRSFVDPSSPTSNQPEEPPVQVLISEYLGAHSKEFSALAKLREQVGYQKRISRLS